MQGNMQLFVPLVFILTVKKNGGQQRGGFRAELLPLKWGQSSLPLKIGNFGHYKDSNDCFPKSKYRILVMETTTFGERNLDIL